MRLYWVDEHKTERHAEAIREYTQRDVETDGLAAAIFRCRLISLGLSTDQVSAELAEHGMTRRRAKLPAGVTPIRGTP